MPDAFRHFVFVDFENVPSIELGLIEGKPVKVTLLVGKNQTRLELPLVRQIHRFAAQVALVEVGASGRNALDLVLAAYLGRATLEHPGGDFVIVSRDKDFDPLIAHLLRTGVSVTRVTDFAALPFVTPPTRVAAPAPVPAAPSRTPSTPRSASAGAARKPTSAAPAPLPVDKLDKLMARLTADAGPRPKRKDRLLAHISTSFGNKLSDAELTALVDRLVQRRILAIDADGKVSYPAATSAPPVTKPAARVPGGTARS